MVTCALFVRNRYIVKKHQVRKRVVYVKGNSPFARVACWWLGSSSVALVWGRTIHIYGTSPEVFFANRTWLAHELIHVHQYEISGMWRFLVSYLWEWIKHGYQNNRYEREARESCHKLTQADIFEQYKFEII